MMVCGKYLLIKDMKKVNLINSKEHTMAIRIPWDEYETAILISACVDYNAGKCTKKEAIKDVSQILRKRAEKNGIEIDDVFRNENGITMQFMLVNELLTQEKCGLRGASKLFISMVELYKSNRTKFQEILMRARKTVEANETNQEQFIAWLSCRLSPAQMSEIYITYYDIDKYLQEEKILETPVLETMDLKKIESIKNMIMTNGKFRFVHRSKMEKYSKAIGYYYAWLSECCEKSETLKMTINERIEEADIRTFESEKKSLDVAKQLEQTKESDGIKLVKFGTGEPYPFTKVEYFEYFGKRDDNVGSWKKLYVKVLQCLMEDYPDEINDLKGKNIGSGTRIDIGDWENSLVMEAPRMFETNLYVETNLNATNILDKIKHLLDLCRIDAENLVVAYSMKENKHREEISEEKPKELEVSELQMAEVEPIVVSADNTELVEKAKEWNLRTFLDEHNLEYVHKTGKSGCLWVLGGREIQLLMMQCWSHGVSFRFRENGGNVTEGKPAWLTRLSEEQFKSWEQAYESNECKYAVIEDLDAKSVPMNGEEKQLALILKGDYENGFRINSAIDRDRIKVFYNKRFGKELPLSDEQLLVSLKKVGVVREGRVYAKQDDKQIDLLKQIFDEVMLVFEKGATCVYPEAIYQKYHIELAEMMQIYEAELLGNALIEMSVGKLRKKQTFLCLTDRQADLDRDVLEVLKKSPIPMTYSDIREVMWYIPLDKIKHVLMVTKSIVQVEQETYFYSLNLPISQEEITEVNRLLYQALKHKMYITDVELRQLIDENCPGIAINTSEFTTHGLRNCLGYILRDSYSFNGPIISSLGKELSMAEVFAQYCDDREQVTTEELKIFASEMNTVIYWDSVRDETIRISDELLLRCDRVEFEIDEIDRVLDALCDKNYIPLKEIGLFMHFPALCVQWNGYVLESYVYKYSKKFRLLHANFSASGFFGAMVRQDSGIEDYRALIVDVLANSNQWEDKNSALELLVEQGYQQRRKYADIEKVVHEAKLLREKINEARK